MKIPALFFAVLCAATVAHAQEFYGTIRSTTKMRPDGTTSTTVTDPDKHTAEETISDGKGRPLRKTIYILGERDVAVGAIFEDGKGKVLYKASYQRDALGRVVESAFSSPDDRYLGKRIFTYGARDAEAQVADYDAQGRLITPAASSTSKKRR